MPDGISKLHELQCIHVSLVVVLQVAFFCLLKISNFAVLESGLLLLLILMIVADSHPL